MKPPDVILIEEKRNEAQKWIDLCVWSMGKDKYLYERAFDMLITFCK